MSLLHQISSVPLGDQLVLAIQVVVACIAGGIVGLEREFAGKRAGLRTHMLCAVAAALAIGLGRFALDGGTGDATRVFHGVLTGIGFIGAGAILYSKRQSGAGLTTAATIFLVAVLGAASAFGAPLLALGGAILAIVLLRGLYVVERPLRFLVDKVRRSEGADEDDEDDLG
jgi:putative Mg2+ transporter-C (MgtC) family protein